MQTPSTLWIWLSDQAGPLLLIALLLAFVMVVLYLSARSRRARMNAIRSGANEDTFVNALLEYGFDGKIARTTYRYLQVNQNVSFPIDVNDHLDEDLGLGSGDVDQTVIALLQENGRAYQPGIAHTPLVTVEDLVRLIQASPRLSELAA